MEGLARRERTVQYHAVARLNLIGDKHFLKPQGSPSPLRFFQSRRLGKEIDDARGVFIHRA